MSKQRTGSMSQDEAFDILSNARRRYVLYYLREADARVELGELADELAAWENGTTVENLTKQERKRVYVSLYQTHIQKLADANIVEYDQETSMVRLAGGASEVGGYLSVAEDEAETIRWELVYVALAAVSGLVYALVALDVPVFALFSEFQTGLVILAAFSVLALVQYVYGRRRSSEIPTDALIRDDV